MTFFIAGKTIQVRNGHFIIINGNIDPKQTVEFRLTTGECLALAALLKSEASRAPRS